MSVPNLDAMSDEDLLTWANEKTPYKRAKDLFPEGGARTVRATRDLHNYAHNKAAAMRCRVNGHIETAKMYEGICDRIYGALPTWARW